MVAPGRGRKRTPLKIVMLRGGTEHTHNRINTEEPRPPERMPRCPKHLDALARKEWHRVARILAPIGYVTEIDLAVFAAYCVDYSRWVQATEQLQQSGMVLKRKDGSPIFSPYLRIEREAFDRWMKAGAAMGLSPTSRAMLKVAPKKPASKVESFMGREHGQAK